MVTVSAGANVIGIDFSVALAAYGGISGRIDLPCVSFPYKPAAVGAPSVQVYTGSGVLAGASVPEPAKIADCPSFDYSVAGLPAGQYYLLVRDLPAFPSKPGFAVTGGLIDELYNDIVCVTADCDVTRGTPVSVTAGAVTAGIDFQMLDGSAISVADVKTWNSGPPTDLAILDVQGSVAGLRPALESAFH